MLIDSMIIKLIRGGAGISPEYKLTIYGDGIVFYEGIENVRVKGIRESSIGEDAILSILDEFKKSGFFSVSDIFFIEESINRPFTSISISIPKEDGEIIRKSVKYYHEDIQVPKVLKNLEDKIDEIVGTVKWISVSSAGFETKKDPISIATSYIEKKTTLEPRKKKPIVLIYLAIFIVILTIIVAYGLYSGIINLLKGEEDVLLDKLKVEIADNCTTGPNQITAKIEIRAYSADNMFDSKKIVIINGRENTNVEGEAQKINSITTGISLSSTEEISSSTMMSGITGSYSI